MSTIKKITGTAVAISAATTMSLVGASPAQAQASGTYAGCESGYVCIYPDASWNHDPILKFYTYGAHNLNNVYGYKRIFNNQTGNAKAQVCYNYNGGNCGGYIPSWSYEDHDFGPINSIRLSA